MEKQRKERLRNRKENLEFVTEGMEVDGTTQYNEDEQQFEQQMIIKSNSFL